MKFLVETSCIFPTFLHQQLSTFMKQPSNPEVFCLYTHQPFQQEGRQTLIKNDRDDSSCVLSWF